MEEMDTNQLRFGLHYSLQSPDGGWADLYQAFLEQAKLAEALGYDSINVAEHHFLSDGWIPAQMVILGAIAAVTDHVTVGTDITILPLHHPINIAERATVLDLLSKGRARLGVAVGWREEEYAAFDVDMSSRGERIEEQVEIIRLLTSEEHVTFDGNFYSIGDITTMPRPLQQPIPIRYGGQSKLAIDRAARLADAWIMSPLESLEELRKKTIFYSERLEEYGRSLSEVNRPLRREMYVAEDDETAWEEVGEALLYEYEEVYSTGYDDVDERFEGIGEDERIEVIREHADGRFIIGGPETAIRQLKEFHRSIGMNELLLRMHFPGLSSDLVSKSIRITGEEIIPQFE